MSKLATIASHTHSVNRYAFEMSKPSERLRKKRGGGKQDGKEEVNE